MSAENLELVRGEVMRWLLPWVLSFVSVVFAQDILVFGGPDEDVFLGCLTCSEYATDSVFNKYGSYGSEYSRESMWNRYADYGSRYSQYSACNPYAQNPPIVVDRDGGFYGRLTLNRFHAEVSRSSELIELLETSICVD